MDNVGDFINRVIRKLDLKLLGLIYGNLMLLLGTLTILS